MTSSLMDRAVAQMLRRTELPRCGERVQALVEAMLAHWRETLPPAALEGAEGVYLRRDLEAYLTRAWKLDEAWTKEVEDAEDGYGD